MSLPACLPPGACTATITLPFAGSEGGLLFHRSASHRRFFFFLGGGGWEVTATAPGGRGGRGVAREAAGMCAGAGLLERAPSPWLPVAQSVPPVCAIDLH